MNIKKLLNKKVVKLTVKDLKEKLAEANDDSEVVLTFYMKDEGLYSVYLADVHPVIGYDAVIKEHLFDEKVCELSGFNHKECTYLEKKNEK